jgi:hypothetical protein
MSTWTTKEIGAAAVNVAGYEIFNFKVTESLPPNSPFGRLLTTSGVQTTPQLARGFLPGSTVDESSSTVVSNPFSFLASFITLSAPNFSCWFV